MQESLAIQSCIPFIPFELFRSLFLCTIFQAKAEAKAAGEVAPPPADDPEAILKAALGEDDDTSGGAANADAAAAAAAIAAAGGGSSDALICECKTADCGYTLFVAAGREDKFFPDGFTCPECGVGKDEFEVRKQGE